MNICKKLNEKDYEFIGKRVVEMIEKSEAIVKFRDIDMTLDMFSCPYEKVDFHSDRLKQAARDSVNIIWNIIADLI